MFLFRKKLVSHAAIVIAARHPLRRVALLIGLLIQLFEIRSAPAATGSRTEAIGQLSDASRLFDAQVIHDFAFRNVKTETEFVIEFHKKKPCR
jgi:hypothetical protein